MIITILIALAIAKKKGLAIKPFIQSPWFYPLFALEFCYMSIQFFTYHGNYFFIPYASYLQKAFLYSLFLPIIRFRLYIPSFIGSMLIFVGTALNGIVIAANSGKMPVYASLSKLTGYYSELPIGSTDTLHCIGDEHTQFKLLSDIFDTGYSILSIGDLFIHSFTGIIVYYAIVQLNQAKD